jgi:hypothetical protein
MRRAFYRLDNGAGFCLAAMLLLAYAPLIGFVALAVVIDSAGPVLSNRKRLLRGWRDAEALVFRTIMEDERDCGSDAEQQFDARRSTRIGMFLRNSGLDQLPRLLNVLHGRPLAIFCAIPELTAAGAKFGRRPIRAVCHLSPATRWFRRRLSDWRP